MVLAKYSVGVDFGTLSGRAVLVNVETGEECASAVLDYPHAGHGPRIAGRYAAWFGLGASASGGLSGSASHDHSKGTSVGGGFSVGRDRIGIDMTSSTAMRCIGTVRPFALQEEYQSDPHAYVKLWKHHSPQKLADRMNEVANERGESFLKRYGGKISSEWYFRNSGKF